MSTLVTRNTMKKMMKTTKVVKPDPYTKEMSEVTSMMTE
jgi:hypothetical protein